MTIIMYGNSYSYKTMKSYREIWSNDFQKPIYSTKMDYSHSSWRQWRSHWRGRSGTCNIERFQVPTMFPAPIASSCGFMFLSFGILPHISIFAVRKFPMVYIYMALGQDGPDNKKSSRSDGRARRGGQHTTRLTFRATRWTLLCPLFVF
jgi:hypothetical protein